MDMNVPVEVIDAQTGDVFGQAVNALSIHTPLDSLFGEYYAALAEIKEIAAKILKSNAVGYFLDGYKKHSRDYMPCSTALFMEDHAVAALDAEYWQRAMGMTDVLKVMPAARRNEWNEQIRGMTTPSFEEQTVRDTMRDLMYSRQQFFAEKVDGIFRALSGDHVTNTPQGFSKRMIISRMLDEWGSTNYRRVEYVHDLRAVIANFLGREEMTGHATSDVIRSIALDGQWNTLDGGALRIRLYKKGTAHLEIHPDVAWRLNKILAFLYPAAIPSEFRVKPAKPHKEYVLRDDVLSQRICDEITVFAQSLNRRRISGPQSLETKGIVWREEVEHIFTMLGAVETAPGQWAFDYNPGEVLAEVARSCLVPDQRSHQFYPTPELLAKVVVAMAEIGEKHEVLEPSAGTAAIAIHLPIDRTQCVEISALHCTILEKMGYPAENTDFLAWNPGRSFDRIVMNPPFSSGRAKAHVTKAATLLAPLGRLVAILPGGLKDAVIAPGMKHTWSPLRSNEFKDANVSVTILTLDRG